MLNGSHDICPLCYGDGWDMDEGVACPRCAGTGKRLQNTRRAPRRIERLLAFAAALAIAAAATWALTHSVEADDAVPSYLSARQRADRGLPARIAALPPSVTVERTPAAEGVPSAGAPTNALTDAERPKPETLADFLARPEVLRLLGQTESGQWIAAYCHQIRPDAPDDVIHLIAEEWVRWRILHPDHPSVTQKRRWLKLIAGESGFCPPCTTPPYGAVGLCQFLPSTCGWFGSDVERFRTPRGSESYAADVRYQYREGCRLLGSKDGGWWSQWSADPGRCD
jgi:hypothetical protein